MLITGGSLSTDTPKYQVGVVAFDGAGTLSGSNGYGAAGKHTTIAGSYNSNSQVQYFYTNDSGGSPTDAFASCTGRTAPT